MNINTMELNMNEMEQVQKASEQGSIKNMIDYHVKINGIPVIASYSEQAVEEIFLPLLTGLTEMQKRKGRRILVMLAAPPGAGKSTLLSFLEHLTQEHGDPGSIQTIGMDGFHRRQEYLVSHTVQHDGEEIPMVKIKGAPLPISE